MAAQIEGVLVVGPGANTFELQTDGETFALVLPTAYRSEEGTIFDEQGLALARIGDSVRVDGGEGLPGLGSCALARWLSSPRHRRDVAYAVQRPKEGEANESTTTTWLSSLPGVAGNPRPNHEALTAVTPCSIGEPIPSTIRRLCQRTGSRVGLTMPRSLGAAISAAHAIVFEVVVEPKFPDASRTNADHAAGRDTGSVMSGSSRR